MIPIVIPLHHGGGKLKDNSELRFALRSLDRHFKEPFEVVIVGRSLPAGFQGLKHLPCGQGLKSALKVAADAYPAGFFWLYDDNILLRDTDAKTMRVTPACKVWRKARTSWARSLEKIRQRLVKEGHAARDYSRPHGPYWFDKSMVDEGFRDWPKMAAKFPWESWILSKRKWPCVYGAVKQYYGPFRGGPGDGSRYLNFNDKGFSAELRKWLQERFPEPSRFETPPSVVAEPSRRVKLEVHTIRFGSAWWMSLCAPTLDAWCGRHGHPLKIWDKSNIDPSYPAEKFCEIDMMREFLAGDSEWLLYVDADVYVDAEAPAHPEPSADFLIREDLPGGGPRDFRRWCQRNRKSAPGWLYRNAGVWMCSREGARQMLDVMAPPFIEGCQEQHQFNWWLSEAATFGLEVSLLSSAWNAWAFENGRGAFYHIAGQRKTQRLAMFRANGRIPSEQAPTPPVFAKAFADDRYHPNSPDLRVETDPLHIHLLHVACSLDTGTPPEEKVAVEIGSHKGRSTAALVDALNKGLIGHLHIVEINPTAELRSVLAMADPMKFTVHTKPFWNTDIGRADLVFIDGEHRWPALADTMRALTWGAKVICMHDTQAWPQVEYCWGSHLAGRMLKDAPGRQWFEDAIDRPGSRTNRGFLVSTESGIDITDLESFLGTVQ